VETGFHAEFVAGVSKCPSCGEYLVERLPDEDEPEAQPPRTPRGDTDVEPVFESWNPSEVTVVKTLLDSAGIPYVTLGAESFDAFHGGRSPMKFSPTSGSVFFLVPKAVAEQARALLEGVDTDDVG
jgi:hypothetical protein